MTSIEHIVGKALDNEIDRLVPEGLKAPSVEKTNRANLPPIRDRRVSASRWKIPALIAGSVAAVTIVGVVVVSSVRTPLAEVPASPVSGGVVIASEGNMPTAVRDHAIQLLTKWNDKLRQNPRLVLPYDFVAVPAKTVPADEVKPTRNVITITVTGSPDLKNHDCGYDYSASAVEGSNAVVIFVSADPGTWPGGTNIGCTSVGFSRTTELRLAEPLAGRAVIDAMNGRIVAVD